MRLQRLQEQEEQERQLAEQKRREQEMEKRKQMAELKMKSQMDKAMLQAKVNNIFIFKYYSKHFLSLELNKNLRFCHRQSLYKKPFQPATKSTVIQTKKSPTMKANLNIRFHLGHQVINLQFINFLFSSTLKHLFHTMLSFYS